MKTASGIIAAILAISGIEDVLNALDSPDLFVKSPFTRYGTCANQSPNAGGTKCSRDHEGGSIYCKPCRVACGGYDRYNPPRRLAA